MYPMTVPAYAGAEGEVAGVPGMPKAHGRREGLEDEAALQSWFIRRIGDWLHARGRQLVGWDEILEGGVEGLTSNAIIMSWRVRRSY